VPNILANVIEQSASSIAALQMYFVYIVREGGASVTLWERHKAKEKENLLQVDSISSLQFNIAITTTTTKQFHICYSGVST